MALDSGKANLNTLFDARGALHYGKFAIHDTHPLGRSITLSEVFTFSSNVGAARVALSQGVEAHKAFLRKVGQLDRLRTELPESTSPLVPKRWSELNTITIAFGHGIAVAPLQAVMGINAMVNGGFLIPPTFLKRSEEDAKAMAKRVDQAGDVGQDPLFDAAQCRDRHRQEGRRQGLLYRRQDRHLGKGGQWPLFQEAGAQLLHGHPARRQPAVPAPDHAGRAASRCRKPSGFITSGWNAVPTGGKVIARIAPLLGIEPRFDLPPSDRLILAASKTNQ